jgi:hypothetical protein
VKSSESFEFMPFAAGAVGGAVAVSLAAKHTGIPRQTIALGGASIASVVSVSTTGLMRQVATGVAIASSAIAVYDFVCELQRESEAEKKRNAAPPIEANASPSTAAPQAPPSEVLTEDHLAHLQAIANSLTPAEREKLAHMEKHAPAEMVRRLKLTLVGMTVEDAVAYLRSKILAHPFATNGQSCDPPRRR